MRQPIQNLMQWHNRLTAQLVSLVVLLVSASPTVTLAAQSITYYHWDALGSPVAATDEAGNVKWREEYQPYGEKIQNQPQSQTNTRWYTGHPHDNATGLSYMGARWYDPVVGRFMAIDPKDFSERDPYSFNRYAYTNNNPYKYVDPDGRRVVLSGHTAADFLGRATSPTSFHLSLILIPDRPQDFANDTSGRWVSGSNGSLSMTIGGQPSLGSTLGNLQTQFNYPGDDLGHSEFQMDIKTPTGMTDTQFINKLIKAAESYNNNLDYDLFPLAFGGGYNSNSYVSGVLRAAGAGHPKLKGNFQIPGYYQPDKPIPLPRQ